MKENVRNVNGKQENMRLKISSGAGRPIKEKKITAKRYSDKKIHTICVYRIY